MSPFVFSQIGKKWILKQQCYRCYEVTTCFLIVFKPASQEAIHVWYQTEEEPMAWEILGPTRESYTLALLNRHII